MSETIPEDVMSKAWEVAKSVALHDPQSRVALVEGVARALMAERERCAQIAESNNAWPQEGADIAAEIRGFKPCATTNGT